MCAEKSQEPPKYALPTNDTRHIFPIKDGRMPLPKMAGCLDSISICNSMAQWGQSLFLTFPACF